MDIADIVAWGPLGNCQGPEVIQLAIGGTFDRTLTGNDRPIVASSKVRERSRPSNLSKQDLGWDINSRSRTGPINRG